METRFSASGRPESPAASEGSGSGSVLALRIFVAIVSASSVMLIRERSEGSDFDIFFMPSRRLMIRVAGPWISGSGSGKNASPKPLPRMESAEIVVELLGDVAGKLEVLLLVLADRHMRCAIDEDVGRHQDGIGEQTDRSRLPVLARLLLELRHPVEPTHPGDAVEHPRELGMLRHLALVEDDMRLRVDPRGEESSRHLADRARPAPPAPATP